MNSTQYPGDIGQHASIVRDMIFEAQALVDMSAAASDAESKLTPYTVRKVLTMASEILDKAAWKLAPDEIEERVKSEAPHG